MGDREDQETGVEPEAYADIKTESRVDKTEEIPGAKFQEDESGSDAEVTLVTWQGIKTNLGTWTEKQKELVVDLKAEANLRTESMKHLIADQTRISKERCSEIKDWSNDIGRNRKQQHL